MPAFYLAILHVLCWLINLSSVSCKNCCMYIYTFIWYCYTFSTMLSLDIKFGSVWLPINQKGNNRIIIQVNLGGKKN